MHKKSSPMLWRRSKGNFRFISPDEDIIGIIDSYSIVYNEPNGFENRVPYILAIVTLNNGEKTISEIVDCKEVSIGMKVEPCLRIIHTDGGDGIIHYGTKFRLIK